MLRPADQVGGFFLRVVVWMPICFVIWYYMAIVMVWPVQWLVELAQPWMLPKLVAGVEQQGYEIDFITRIIPTAEQLGGLTPQPGQIAELSISVNPLIYGYGVPLFTALVLASPDEMDDKWLRWSIGILVLLPVQAFGVNMELLKTLALGMGQQVTIQLGYDALQLEAIALGYQLGYLILPAVAPIAIWVGMYRFYLERLAPGLSAKLSR